MNEKLEELERRLYILERYVDTQIKNKYYPNSYRSGSIGGTKCMWDGLPERDRFKPMGLSCPCPKCSAWC